MYEPDLIARHIVLSVHPRTSECPEFAGAVRSVEGLVKDVLARTETKDQARAALLTDVNVSWLARAAWVAYTTNWERAEQAWETMGDPEPIEERAEAEANVRAFLESLRTEDETPSEPSTLDVLTDIVESLRTLDENVTSFLANRNGDEMYASSDHASRPVADADIAESINGLLDLEVSDLAPYADVLDAVVRIVGGNGAPFQIEYVELSVDKIVEARPRKDS